MKNITPPSTFGVTTAARKFVPSMPQDNFPNPRTNRIQEAAVIARSVLRQRTLVQDSLNRKADR
jgi:hypothetical protein